MQFVRSARTGSSRARIGGAVLATLVAWLASPYAALAQTTVDQEALRQRQRVEDAERQVREAAPAVHTRAPLEEDSDELPAETPCFPIREIRLEGAERGFTWAQRWVRRYEGRCLGEQGVNLVARRLTQRILARGKVTTRVGVPEQNLKEGRLRLAVVAGTLARVTFADDRGPRTRWKTALPLRPGDLIDVRELDQGLEQLKRIPSQDVELLLRPGEQAGQSDLELRLRRTRPWRASLSVDDGGSPSTGKLQATLTAAIDDPLTLNDLLSVSAQRDADFQPRDHATWGVNGSYSMPWGYWTFSTSGGTSEYRQNVAMSGQDLRYRGRNTNLDVEVERVIHRGQASKTTASLSAAKRWGQTWLEDVEIEVQRRDVTSATLGLGHRYTTGKTTVEGQVAVRRGLPFLAQEDRGSAEAGTTQFTLGTGRVSVTAPFQLGMPLRWRTEVRGQYADERLLVADQFAIGGRYTVRGFDGETTLAAESGACLRNELGMTLPRVRQELYVALDAGIVDGPSAGKLVGAGLVGAAVGIRGGLWVLSWDAFAGLPVYHPSGFETARPALGFSATALY